MRRVPELDALRGLAAIFVVLFHFRPLTFRGGWSAVDMFFVLSGYLITSIILRHGSTEHFFRSFYARRTLRIWPIYYLTLLTLIVVNPFLPTPLPQDGMPNYLTFTQNIQYYLPHWKGLAPWIGAPFYPMWSLALEEQFYLFWPCVVLFLGRKRLVPVTIIMIVVGVIARYRGFSLHILMTRSDGFALGSLLAILVSDPEWLARNEARFKGVLFALGIVAFVGMAWVTLSFPNGGSTGALPWLGILLVNVFYCAAVGLVVTSVGSRYLAPLRGRALGYVGLISYGLYLYHSIAFSIVDYYETAWGIGPRWWLEAIKLALPFAAAAFSWHIIERPILSLKDRFGYAHGRSNRDKVVEASGVGAGAEALAAPEPRA